MAFNWKYAAAFVVAAFIAFYLYNKYKVAPALNVLSLDISDLEGTKVSLDAYKGKKLIVCFGASWCVNCREELDVLSGLSETELADVEVVVISDETPEKISAFKNKKNYPFTFYKLNIPFSSMGIYSIPTTYLVNTQLQVVKQSVGYLNWTDPSSMAHYKKLMD